MIEDFEGLKEEERNLMFSVPILITVLIAGADSIIDQNELDEAILISRLKKNTGQRALSEYFEVISGSFESDLLVKLKGYPKETTERNPVIIAELETLNSILPKLDKRFAVQFYESMKDLAKSVAEASGGIMGFMAVGYDESKLVGLEMIKEPYTSDS